MSGMVSFTVTQDVLDNPKQYRALTNKLSICSICINDFSPGERILASSDCRHYFHYEELLTWIAKFPKKTVYYSTTIELKPPCPVCKTILNSKDITNLTKAQVLEKREDPIEDESSEAEVLSGDTSDLNELEKKALVNKTPNPNYSKEKFFKVVKIAAIVTVATALIFLSVKALQS